MGKLEVEFLKTLLNKALGAHCNPTKALTGKIRSQAPFVK